MSEKLNPGMGINPWPINLFERSFFTVTLATGTALMLWLLTSGQSQQTIQVVYFAIPVSVMLLVLCIENYTQSSGTGLSRGAIPLQIYGRCRLWR